MELWKSEQCKLPVSFRQLLEVNEHTEEKVYSQLKERVKRATDNMDEPIVWHSCVLWLTCRGPEL